jgi:hypothetical protein
MCNGFGNQRPTCNITDRSIVAMNASPHKDHGLACWVSKCSTDGTCSITLSCPEGSYGSGPPTIMNTSNWVTQPLPTGTCKQCPAGKFGDVINAKTASVCQDCIAGQYATSPGGSNCSNCKKGEFAAIDGSKVCTKCPDGLLSNPPIGGTECIHCKGIPICLDRGYCSTKTGACVCNKDPPNGWEGLSCETCNIKWKDGECDKCAHGYKMWSNQCQIACPLDQILNQNTGNCVQTWQTIFWKVVSIVIAIFTPLAFFYKIYIFRNLRREGRINPEYSTLKAFIAVFSYGENGKHVVDNNMEAALLDEEQDTSVNPRDSFVEMGERRASMDTFLADADLSRVADALERDGVYRTRHLLEMDEDDMDAAGLRRAEKTRLLRAQEQFIATRSNNDNGTVENEAENIE